MQEKTEELELSQIAVAWGEKKLTEVADTVAVVPTRIDTDPIPGPELESSP